MKLIADDMVTGLLDKSWYQLTSCPHTFPIVSVSEKDGSLQFFVDYRLLESQTVRYLLPRFDGLLIKLLGAPDFSSFDLESGYHQIRLTPQAVA